MNKKYLKTNNEWNTDGLLDSITDEEIVICPKSGTKLYFVKENGSKVKLNTYGICYNCNLEVARAELNIPEWVQVSSYPVVYVGRICKDCSKSPKPQWDSQEQQEEE